MDGVCNRGDNKEMSYFSRLFRRYERTPAESGNDVAGDDDDEGAAAAANDDDDDDEGVVVVPAEVDRWV